MQSRIKSLVAAVMLSLAIAAAPKAYSQQPALMAADVDPAFDVATIKPNTSGAAQKGLNVNGRTLTARNVSLLDLLSYVYRVHPSQIEAAPGWVSSSKYDVSGVPDAAGTPSAEQWRTMMKKLIDVRFALKMHSGKKLLDVYALTAINQKMIAKQSAAASALPSINFKPVSNGLTLSFHNETLQEFCEFMQQIVLDRAVIDHTTFPGKFDFSVTFMPDQSQFAGYAPVPPIPDGIAAAPGLSAALAEDLGLRLAREKTEANTVVIDSVAPPSEN